MFGTSVLTVNFTPLLRGRVALRAETSHPVAACISVPPVEMSSTVGPHHRPLRLIVSRPSSSHSAMRCLPVRMLGAGASASISPRPAQNLGALHLFLRRVDGDIGLMRVVQEREHAVVLFLLQRIVLVVVALRALDGDAENALADGIHAVEHGLHAELLGIDAALFVDHGIAQEAGGDDLVLRGIAAAGRRRSDR